MSRKNPATYVIKPSGEAQNIKRLLFVGQEDDGMDVIHVLQSYKAVYSDTIKVFQLQRRVRGVEVAVGAFFNGSDFMMPINVNFEHKLLFPGDIGPVTGEMGTCMYWSGPNKVFAATLAKLRERFARNITSAISTSIASSTARASTRWSSRRVSATRPSASRPRACRCRWANSWSAWPTAR